MKEKFLALMSFIGGAAGVLLGGWDSALTTLVIFMSVDYITGIIVAGVFQASGKTQNGALESGVGFKGILKKIVMLLVVMVGYRIDLTMGTTFVKDAIIMAFISNELISITENLGLMGVPMPEKLKKAIELLKSKGDE